MKMIKIRKPSVTLMMVITIISCLLMSTFAFAENANNTNKDDTKKSVAIDTAQFSPASTSTYTLTDGSNVSETLNSNEIYSVIAPDNAARGISVSCSTPVKTIIETSDSIIQPFVLYNSGDYRMSSWITWHFQPNTYYILVVEPQSFPATVNISMSKTTEGNLTWLVNKNGTTLTEKNILNGGQKDVYSIGNETDGTYTLQVQNMGISSLTVMYSDVYNPSNNEVKTLSVGQTWARSKTLKSTKDTTQQNVYDQSKYAIFVQDNDNPAQGGNYVVTISK